MAMKNPPRRTTIRGQKHLLAYITPEEAQLLMDNGGSGEPGPMGIPSFPPGRQSGGGANVGPDRDSGGGEGGRSGPGDMGDPRGGFDSGYTSGYGRSENADAAAAAAQAAIDAAAAQAVGQSPGAMGGAIGSAYQTAPSVGTGFDVQLQKARSAIAASPYTGWVDRMIENAYQTGKAPGPMGSLFDVPIGRFQNFKTAPPGYKGVFRSFDMLTPLTPGPISTVMQALGLPTEYYMTTGWGNSLPTGDGPDTVPATTNPVTGEQDQCPDGYMFDEDLQACRLAGGLPGSDGQVMTTSGPYEAGDYARMGLLDVAPMGMGLFADRYGAGFGTPSDFSTANLAFRRGAATRPQYFKQAPDLTGYTLLS